VIVSATACYIAFTKAQTGAVDSRPQSRYETTAHVQSISFAAKPLLRTLQFGPDAIDLVILEHDIPNAAEHIGLCAFENCKFSTLAVDFQEIDAFDGVVLEEFT